MRKYVCEKGFQNVLKGQNSSQWDLQEALNLQNTNPNQIRHERNSKDSVLEELWLIGFRLGPMVFSEVDKDSESVALTLDPAQNPDKM